MEALPVAPRKQKPPPHRTKRILDELSRLSEEPFKGDAYYKKPDPFDRRGVINCAQPLNAMMREGKIYHAMKDSAAKPKSRPACLKSRGKRRPTAVVASSSSSSTSSDSDSDSNSSDTASSSEDDIPKLQAKIASLKQRLKQRAVKKATAPPPSKKRGPRPAPTPPQAAALAMISSAPHWASVLRYQLESVIADVHDRLVAGESGHARVFQSGSDADRAALAADTRTGPFGESEVAVIRHWLSGVRFKGLPSDVFDVFLAQVVMKELIEHLLALRKRLSLKDAAALRVTDELD